MESRRVQRLKLAMRKVAFYLFFTSLFLTTIYLSFAQAAPGDLDPTFGVGGMVSTPMGEYPTRTVAHAVAIQSDGKLVAVGQACGCYPFVDFWFSGRGFAVVRYNTDGSLDTTFGSGGIVTAFDGDFSGAAAHALVIQVDGKIVVAGTSGNGFMLIRYNTDGSLDLTFGTGGIVDAFIGDSAKSINGLAIQPDGKIVAVGGSNPYNDPPGKFTLARYNSNGTLDSGFGSGGIVTTLVGTFGSSSAATSIALQLDGKIVVTGRSDIGIVVARYNMDGTLDHSFGAFYPYQNGSGFVIAPMGNDGPVHAVAIQLDGKIVVTGNYFVYYQGDRPRYQFVLIRYMPNGFIDSTFAGGGILITNMTPRSSLAMSLAIQADGKLLVGGGSNDLGGNGTLVRYDSNGFNDNTFGTNGIVLYGLSGMGLAIQADGKIVAAGFSTGGYPNFTLARYLANSGPNLIPSADNLTPINIPTLPSVTQNFTAIYSDPDGWQNIADVSLSLSGTAHGEMVHYNPVTDKFILQGASEDCTPGQATTFSNAYLTLNCSSSSTSAYGNVVIVTYNLTPQPSLSGAAYRLILTAADQAGASSNKDMGYWIVNRRPSACNAVPMNSTTPVGTQQTFVCAYSDQDGYQNIAEANFYLAGGLHNEWVHYISAANIFFIMGAPGVCTPGQATSLSNGYLTFDCATSSVSGSGTNLTVAFRVTPLGPSSGINYNIFTGASDHAGGAYGLFAGTWHIQ